MIWIYKDLQKKKKEKKSFIFQPSIPYSPAGESKNFQNVFPAE